MRLALNVRLSDVPCFIVSVVPSPLKGETVWLTLPFRSFAAGAVPVVFEVALLELDTGTECGGESGAVAAFPANTLVDEAADLGIDVAIRAVLCLAGDDSVLVVDNPVS